MMECLQSTGTASVSLQPLVSEFRENGYCLVRKALDGRQVSTLLKSAEYVATHPGPYDSKTKFMAVALRDTAILRLVEHSTVFPLIVSVLQHYNIFLYTSQIATAPPASARNVGWHTDGGQPLAKASEDLAAFLSLKVGYFLTDALVEDSGNLEVVPGSHKRRLDWKLYSTKELAESLDTGRIEGGRQLLLAAGDAVVFDQRLWHSTAPNRTERTRVAVYLGYAYGQLRPLDYVSAPDHILTSASPITQQMLCKRQSPFTAYSFYAPEEEDVPLKAWFERQFGRTWI